ncbi:MAG: 3-dehydroquinate synthase [Cellvibrionaceae bacterium]
MNSTLKQLTVDLGDQRSYPIFIGGGSLNDIDFFAPYISGRQVCIVSNETIAPLYLQALVDMLSPHYQVDAVILPDGEKFKTLEILSQIYDCLLEKKHNRTTTLIALGGGVVGDMTGFAAASYQRGVNFIQVPTTLLSQVDSSVGGKTGVNHPLGKNMIGAFHQPRSVIIDTNVLATLPARELSAGIAEIIKYGLIIDSEFYQWLEDHMAELKSLESSIIIEAIARSCETKADVVSQDEKESGIRAILNLGHTFGHAIEAAQGYGNWLHGEAVAAGMVVAAELSAQLGWIKGGEVDRLRTLLVAAELPVQIPSDMSVEKFLDLMSVDKKVIDGRLRLVLLKAIGESIVTDEAPKEAVASAIGACY